MNAQRANVYRCRGVNVIEAIVDQYRESARTRSVTLSIGLPPSSEVPKETTIQSRVEGEMQDYNKLSPRFSQAVKGA